MQILHVRAQMRTPTLSCRGLTSGQQRFVQTAHVVHDVCISIGYGGWPCARRGAGSPKEGTMAKCTARPDAKRETPSGLSALGTTQRWSVEPGRILGQQRLLAIAVPSGEFRPRASVVLLWGM